MNGMDDLITQLRVKLDETGRLALAAVEFDYGVKDWADDGDPVNIHIARHDPASVLRMVAAHRKILDLHAPYDAADDGDLICQTCLEGQHLYEEKAYPCPTLKLIAEGYGIEA